MQYQIPQFIDIEDKIVGPFTFKQFIYIAGGAGLCFLAYKLLPFWIALLVILPVGSLSAALAFYKINDKPFMFTLEAAFNYFLAKKLYIWKARPPEKKKDTQTVAPTPVATTLPPARLTSSKLRDIAWSLDVLDKKAK
jgi:hypothetical protein